jgi:hypothetical protein
MQQRLSDDQIRELTDLWARLENLTRGIGAWVITAATAPPAWPALQDGSPDDKVRELVDAAVKVRDRIRYLTAQAPPDDTDALTSGDVLVRDDAPAVTPRRFPEPRVRHLHVAP